MLSIITISWINQNPFSAVLFFNSKSHEFGNDEDYSALNEMLTLKKRRAIANEHIVLSVLFFLELGFVTKTVSYLLWSDRQNLPFATNHCRNLYFKVWVTIASSILFFSVLAHWFWKDMLMKELVHSNALQIANKFWASPTVLLATDTVTDIHQRAGSL